MRARDSERRRTLQAWLDDHDLGQHGPLLHANGIGVDVLLDLTDEDLREIGLPPGDRKRLLKAISSSSEESERGAPHRREAERRQLTVMFIDLVGSTELSERLDPEDMSDVLRSYHEAVTEEINRIDGFTAKLMGDGVLAYFGWPRAHENEAERAIRAGLAICEAVAELREPTGQPLRARVGIATGLVVVGDLIGEGAAQEQAVVGDTPNLAARLEGLAEAGTVVVSDATRRLAAGVVEFTDLGLHDLKGIRRPVPAYAVRRLLTFDTRFAAQVGRQLTELAGREEELASLRRSWERARSGNGQVVLVEGEAGIGKSRLLEELLGIVAGDPHATVRYQCSPYHVDSALHPVVEHLRRASAIRPDDTLDEQLDKIERLVGPSDRPVAPAALVAMLLDIDGTSRYGSVEASPAQLRHLTMAMLTELWTRLAAVVPLIWVIEDVQWIDPTTRELIELALDTVPTMPVLVLATNRPDAHGDFPNSSTVERLRLSRLGVDDVAQIVGGVAGSKRLPRDLLDQIVAKTDGVPLFVEETTKAVIESAVVDDADDPTMAGLSDQVPVPTSLHDSLVSRLDRLGPAKDVAQTAAVIGRSFGEHMLAALCGPRENFAASLDRLVGAEVVDVDSSRSASETVYRFRHALLRDVAYASLLKSTRRRLHREIADVLAGAAKPELLAYHQRHAGLLQEAVDSYLLAGRSLMQRGAYLEAENSYRNALVLLDQADEHNVADPERSLRMHLGAGSNATALHGWADGRTFRAYQTARSLAAELDDREGQVMSLAALGFSHGDRGEPQAGIACAEQILELDASTPLHRFIGHAAMAMPAFFHGEFARSSEHARAALTTYEEWMDPYLSELGGPYVPTLCRIYSGWNAWFLGDEDASARWIDVALDAVPESRQPFSHGYTLVFGTILAFFRDDVEAQFDWAMRAVEVGNRYGFQFFSGIGEVFLASARTETEPGPERVAELEAGLAKAGSEDHRSGLPTMLDLVSRIQQKLGAIDAAAETITTAQETAAATHQHYWEPELHRRRGELALVSGDVEQAATAYREAIATASAIGAVALEDRAAASLVALDTG